MRHVIVVTWKETGKIEVFTSLAVFTDLNPGYSQHTINNYITRKKVAYDCEKLSLVKCQLTGPVK